MHTPLVARCVRGLESTVAAEVLASGLGVVTGLRHREVHFRASWPAPRLRTADDVFLLAAQRADIGTTKHGLKALSELAELTDTDRLLRLRRGLTESDELTGIDVSASFLGRRTFNRYDAEDVVGPALARRLGVPYHSRRTGVASPPGHWGWRLTLDGTRATLMLRITDHPQHRRAYKRRTIPGTLHPPLAAAMAAMADISPGQVVVDPCCGAGTLLIEAALAQPGAHFHGFDLSPDAITAARANANAIALPDTVGWPDYVGLPNAVDPPIAIDRSDAGRLPLPDAGVDRVLCNPPWGTQAPARGLIANTPSRWWTELRRVLAPDGRAVLLLPDPEALGTALRHRLTPLHIQRVRVSGAQPFIVHLAPKDENGRRRTPNPPAPRPGHRAAGRRPGVRDGPTPRGNP